ncbi:MAG: cold shock domain-containing protein [Oleiphilus sp.]
MPQGTVKWFNNAKGYGFIVENGESEDLFAHFSSIQMDGYKTLKAGQPVEFEKQPGDKGFHAINIRCAEQKITNDIDHDEHISVEEPDMSFRSSNTDSTSSAQDKAKSTQKASV